MINVQTKLSGLVTFVGSFALQDMQITWLQWREKFVIICRLKWKSRLNTVFMFTVINIGILQLSQNKLRLCTPTFMTWISWRFKWENYFLDLLLWCASILYLDANQILRNNSYYVISELSCKKRLHTYLNWWDENIINNYEPFILN